MLPFLARQMLGIVVVTSPIWGAGLLCRWLLKDRKNIRGSKTSGSATALLWSIGQH